MTKARQHFASVRTPRSHPRCQVCQHPERWRVELLKAGGASLDSLAKKFELSRDAIDRHWHRHVSAELKAGYLAGPVQLQDLAAKAAEQGGSVLDHLHAVRVILMGHLASVTEAGDGRAAAYIAGRLTSTLETIARVSGELGDLARSTTYNITNNVAVLTEQVCERAAAESGYRDLDLRRARKDPGTVCLVEDGKSQDRTKTSGFLDPRSWRGEKHRPRA